MVIEKTLYVYIAIGEVNIGKENVLFYEYIFAKST